MYREPNKDKDRDKRIAELEAALLLVRQHARDAYLSPSEASLHLSHIFRVSSNVLMPPDGGGDVARAHGQTESVTSGESKLGRALRASGVAGRPGWGEAPPRRGRSSPI